MIAQNNVIQATHVNHVQGLLQALGQIQVGLTGRWVAGRMIVRQYHCRRLMVQNGLDDFTGVYRGLIQGAGKERDKGDKMVLLVQQDQTKGFPCLLADVVLQ